MREPRRYSRECVATDSPGLGSFSLIRSCCRITVILCRKRYLAPHQVFGNDLVCGYSSAHVPCLISVGYSQGCSCWRSRDVFPAAQPSASAAETPAATDPENRQFDFWLGDWAITDPNGSSEASSRVSLALGQYLVVENWDDGRSHKGENLFAYSADDKTWHGMFADNQGRVHVFTGKVSGGLAEFYGPSRGPAGEAVLNRIRRRSPSSRQG